MKRFKCTIAILLLIFTSVAEAKWHNPRKTTLVFVHTPTYLGESCRYNITVDRKQHRNLDLTNPMRIKTTHKKHFLIKVETAKGNGCNSYAPNTFRGKPATKYSIFIGSHGSIVVAEQ